MKLLSYSPYDDTGMLGYNLASMWDQCRPHDTYRAVCGAPSYLNFPQHDPWDWRTIVRRWDEADAIHLHDGFHAMPRKRSGLVVTWHGTGFRESSDILLRHQYEHQGIGTVSTLDLWLLAPDHVEWLPAPHDTASYRTIRSEVPAIPGPLRIGHAPTNRALKHTDAFLAACDRIAQEAEIEVVLIEGVEWTESITLKATCDIWYDQVAFGYGGNGIEAMAMGIPVVCGAPDPTLAEYERRFGALPFVLADAGTIYDALAHLMDPEVRSEYGLRGMAHAEAFHSYAAVADRLEPIYVRAATS